MSDAQVNEKKGLWCILLPCSGSERWAVPQNALAEIVTLHADSEQPPETLDWRGQSVPVLDFGHDDSARWCEQVGGTGLVAVFLGLEGERCDYWGVAIRGEGLAVKQVSASEVQEVSLGTVEHASAAFSLNGNAYQVPDLVALQRRIADGLQAA